MLGTVVLLDILVALPGGGELVRRAVTRARQKGLELTLRVAIRCAPYATCRSDRSRAQVADLRRHTSPVPYRWKLHK